MQPSAPNANDRGAAAPPINYDTKPKQKPNLPSIETLHDNLAGDDDRDPSLRAFSGFSNFSAVSEHSYTQTPDRFVDPMVFLHDRFKSLQSADASGSFSNLPLPERIDSVPRTDTRRSSEASALRTSIVLTDHEHPRIIVADPLERPQPTRSPPVPMPKSTIQAPKTPVQPVLSPEEQQQQQSSFVAPQRDISARPSHSQRIRPSRSHDSFSYRFIPKPPVPAAGASEILEHDESPDSWDRFAAITFQSAKAPPSVPPPLPPVSDRREQLSRFGISPIPVSIPDAGPLNYYPSAANYASGSSHASTSNYPGTLNIASGPSNMASGSNVASGSSYAAASGRSTAAAEAAAARNLVASSLPAAVTATSKRSSGSSNLTISLPTNPSASNPSLSAVARPAPIPGEGLLQLHSSPNMHISKTLSPLDMAGPLTPRSLSPNGTDLSRDPPRKTKSRPELKIDTEGLVRKKPLGLIIGPPIATIKPEDVNLDDYIVDIPQPRKSKSLGNMKQTAQSMSTQVSKLPPPPKRATMDITQLTGQRRPDDHAGGPADATTRHQQPPADPQRSNLPPRHLTTSPPPPTGSPTPSTLPKMKRKTSEAVMSFLGNLLSGGNDRADPSRGKPLQITRSRSANLSELAQQQQIQQQIQQQNHSQDSLHMSSGRQWTIRPSQYPSVSSPPITDPYGFLLQHPSDSQRTAAVSKPRSYSAVEKKEVERHRKWAQMAVEAKVPALVLQVVTRAGRNPFHVLSTSDEDPLRPQQSQQPSQPQSQQQQQQQQQQQRRTSGLFAVPPKVRIAPLFEFATDSKFFSRLLKGVPQTWRGQVWYQFITQYSHFYQQLKPEQVDSLEASLLDRFYKSLHSNIGNALETEIAKDCANTMKGHIEFSDHKSPSCLSLYRVLKCFAIIRPDIAYSHGMADIGALLILHMEEERALLSLIHLFHQPSSTPADPFCNLTRLFDPSMIGLMELCYLHEQILALWSPKAWNHLRQLEIDTPSYAIQWFTTLFTRACNTNLPQPASAEAAREAGAGSPETQPTQAAANHRRKISDWLSLKKGSGDSGPTGSGLGNGNGGGNSNGGTKWEGLLPYPVLLRLWDFFFVFGFDFLPVLSAAIVKYYESYIISMDRESAIYFLRSGFPLTRQEIVRIEAVRSQHSRQISTSYYQNLSLRSMKQQSQGTINFMQSPQVTQFVLDDYLVKRDNVSELEEIYRRGFEDGEAFAQTLSGKGMSSSNPRLKHQGSRQYFKILKSSLEDRLPTVTNHDHFVHFVKQCWDGTSQSSSNSMTLTPLDCGPMSVPVTLRQKVQDEARTGGHRSIRALCGSGIVELRCGRNLCRKLRDKWWVVQQGLDVDAL